MKLHSVPALVLTLVPAIAAQPPLKIGIDTQATEWIVSLEGGGQVCDRSGKPLLKLAPDEKLRIWWDSRGVSDPAAEYRIQVGKPHASAEAASLMKRLKELGEAPDKVKVPDADTWRVLTGHFREAGEAEPVLQKLQDLGYEELWVASESRSSQPRKGRALYAITDRYERRPLPLAGIWLRPAGELTALQGKGRYRGKVEIHPNAQGRLTVVNTVDLETYLRGVVPKEMGAWEFPSLEALKAQAVAARTYAVANRGKRAADGFDMGDTVADQVYGGRDGEQALTDRAIAETEGLFATYGGKPIQALFMANCGGHTTDVAHVFGGNAPYLSAVSCYPVRPLTLPYASGVAVTAEGQQPWLSWELLRLASVALPPEWLAGERLAKAATPDDLAGPVRILQQRLALEARPLARDGHLVLALARAFGFQRIVEGQERPQDAAYFLPDSLPEDRLLAAFLTRRGVIPASAWAASEPITLRQALQALGRLWQELEPFTPGEGSLLMDRQVRRKRGGPEPLPMAPTLLLAEESPDGSLRLVAKSDIQVGDRLKWIPGEDGPAQVLVRRLDPDGAAWDRYNPTAHWRVEYTEAELLAMVRKRVYVPGIRDLKAEHDGQGRVLDLTLVDTKGAPHRVHGMHIRGLLGLKDNVFRWLTVGQGATRRWIFYGRGWGHGLGMCQTGAYGMALEGATFEQILQHYYPGVHLQRIE
ncbi:MAG: SpoIID/LytB domain-containing protein [Geothrix sp.]|uniref:SpoIID/LytB domain-containing protein n=1 Tax=Geothrix sp. TaxID=1962974 RepID=UPI0017BD7EDC|nr:SpoIID/LytB domain-containing protein [Geothrix sp.]NWJ40334.1 SpoIID/LytB domain-containing protein [Geothrix sp.]WIL21660.1 MAG: SpoIID/LytB domain-containing protein [Geothrix sp.]